MDVLVRPNFRVLCLGVLLRSVVLIPVALVDFFEHIQAHSIVVVLCFGNVIDIVALAADPEHGEGKPLVGDFCVQTVCEIRVGIAENESVVICQCTILIGVYVLQSAVFIVAVRLKHIEYTHRFSFADEIDSSIDQNHADVRAVDVSSTGKFLHFVLVRRNVGGRRPAPVFSVQDLSLHEKLQSTIAHFSDVPYSRAVATGRR